MLVHLKSKNFWVSVNASAECDNVAGELNAGNYFFIII